MEKNKFVLRYNAKIGFQKPYKRNLSYYDFDVTFFKRHNEVLINRNGHHRTKNIPKNFFKKYSHLNKIPHEGGFIEIVPKHDDFETTNFGFILYDCPIFNTKFPKDNLSKKVKQFQKIHVNYKDTRIVRKWEIPYPEEKYSKPMKRVIALAHVLHDNIELI
jgi:hypothetical protein